MTRRFYTFLIVFLSFTFGEAQENYNQVLESDSAYQKTYDNAKGVDSVIMSGYVTDNPSYNRKFKDDFRNFTVWFSDIFPELKTQLPHDHAGFAVADEFSL